MPSIRDVAKQAGVSIATVSRVLNGHQTVNPELREKVLKAASACDYRPTVGKRTSERVALLYTGPFLIGSTYDAACLDGIAAAMRRSPYDLVMLDMERDRTEGESLQQFLDRKGVCGAIVRSIFDHRYILEEMANESVPLVVLGDHFEHPSLGFCYSDSRGASRDAVEHLVSLGHQSIGFVACDRDDGDHMDRFEVFKEVLSAAGIYREEFVYRVPPFRLDGAPLIRRILSKTERPTALFIADPLVAVGVLNESHRLGVQVPDELSIIAVDDTDVRNMVYPRLSSVCQDSRLVGEMAFDMVCRMVGGSDLTTADSRREEAWFEIHDTTAPPPATVDRFLPSNRSTNALSQ